MVLGAVNPRASNVIESTEAGRDGVSSGAYARSYAARKAAWAGRSGDRNEASSEELEVCVAR